MSTRELIDAIVSGDSQNVQSTFESEMMSRVAARMDTMRQNVAQNMFKVQESVAEQVEDLDEAADGQVGANHIHVQRVQKDGKTMYHVHAVGKNFASGIKTGEHLSDTELDDASEMGAHIKMKKPSK